MRTSRNRIHGFNFHPLSFTISSFYPSVSEYLNKNHIEVLEDTKLLKGRGRWLVSLPVGVWPWLLEPEELFNPAVSREEDEKKYLRFLQTVRGHTIKTRDTTVHNGIRFYSEPALRVLFGLRPELLLLKVAADMLAAFSVTPAIAHQLIKDFQRLHDKTLHKPHLKDVWTPEEDRILNRWFKLGPGGHLSDAIWEYANTQLNNRRSKQGIRRRFKILNRNLYRKLLKEQECAFGKQADCRLNQEYIDEYMAQALGERPCVPGLPHKKTPKKRPAPPHHCPGCTCPTTNKRVLGEPTASQQQLWLPMDLDPPKRN
jgi:hypothetical protein